MKYGDRRVRLNWYFDKYLFLVLFCFKVFILFGTGLYWILGCGFVFIFSWSSFRFRLFERGD